MVGRGYHIALTREHAKRVFNQLDDEALRAFLNELITSKQMIDSGRVLDIGTSWDAIHRCLTEGELDPAGGEFPLNHTILGGKELHKGDDYAATLIRPDITGFVAEALNEIREPEFREKFFTLNPDSYKGLINEKAFLEVWLAVTNLRVFFDAAAENLEAVIFMGKFKE